MQFEEETLEILEPNAAMSPILKALDAALAAHALKKMFLNKNF